MVRFSGEIKKFGSNGEKTGWTFIEIPPSVAEQLHPGNRQSFRVKGKLDAYSIKGLALLPAGSGSFILPLNAALRKQIRKAPGAMLQLHLEEDTDEIQTPPLLLECLEDEPAALARFNSLPRTQRNYFIKWIESAKSEQTIANRVAQTIRAMTTGLGFSAMLREMKTFRNDSLH